MIRKSDKCCQPVRARMASASLYSLPSYNQPPSGYMPCPSQSSRPNHPDYIGSTAQIMKFLIVVHSFPFSSLLGLNIRVRILFSNTLILLSSFNVREGSDTKGVRKRTPRGSRAAVADNIDLSLILHESAKSAYASRSPALPYIASQVSSAY